MISDILLGQWLPDMADYQNPGVVVCDNCYPSPGGYAPFYGGITSGDSVAGTIRGVKSFDRSNGSVVKVVGTTTDLHVVSGGVVTASGLALTLAPNVFWSFEQFNRQIWAFAYGQTPRYLADVDTDVTFVSHPGVAPQAASCNRVGDFLVTANMVDIDASVQPYRLRWSQFNNPAGDYGTDLGTQSGFVDLDPSLGIAIGVFGGRNDVILQKYGVSRLTYTGGGTAFRKDVVEEERGCIAAPSAITVGPFVYFLANDGFCRTDGATVEVISTGRVFEWFTANASEADIGSVQAAINWKLRSVIWSFVPANGAGLSRQIIYSWDQNRWSTASFACDWLFDTTVAGLSLEQVSAANPDLDVMTISLDSAEFKSRNKALSGVSGGDIINLTGDALEAVWQTGDIQLRTGYRSVTQSFYPLVENEITNTAFRVGTRETFKGGSIDWSDPVTVEAGGYAPIIKDGRYVRAEMSVPAGAIWDKSIGMQVEGIVGGRT